MRKTLLTMILIFIAFVFAVLYLTGCETGKKPWVDDGRKVRSTLTSTI